MFGIQAVMLLAVWGLGALLPRIQSDVPVRPVPLAATGQISSPTLTDRARRYVAPQSSEIGPIRPAPDRSRRGVPAMRSTGRIAGGLADRRAMTDRAVVGPTPGKVLAVRYVDQVFAQRRLECSAGHVCVWNDCGPASAAMVLHYEGLEPRDVLNDRRATLDLVCETKPGCQGTTNRDRMLATLQNHGLDAYPVDAPSFAEIQASIDLGHPVILSLTPWPDHVMVAVGYRPAGIVVVHDPYGGKFWWRHMRNINEPFTGHPQNNGERVQYAYADLKLVVIYGLFTTGPTGQAGPAAIIPPHSN